MALTVSDYSKEYADFVVIERSSNGEKIIIIIKSIIYIIHSFLSIIYLPKQFGCRSIRNSAFISSQSEITYFKRLSGIRLEIDNDFSHGIVFDMPKKKMRMRERERVGEPRKAFDISRAIILYSPLEALA